jgi:multidrug transporter EmrE-like cation transporter
MHKNVFVLALISVVMSALAQMSFKWGMSRPAMQSVLGAGERDLTALLTQLVTNPGVLTGFALYGTSALLWLLVLARVDLSVAYPFVGLGFVFTMLAGALLFHEPVTLVRFAGTVLVIGGVALVARS